MTHPTQVAMIVILAQTGSLAYFPAEEAKVEV